MFILLSAFVIAIALFLLFYDYSEPSDINPQAHLANSTTKDPFISSTKTHEKSTKVHVHTSSTPYPVTQTNPIRRLIFAHTVRSNFINQSFHYSELLYLQSYLHTISDLSAWLTSSQQKREQHVLSERQRTVN